MVSAGSADVADFLAAIFEGASDGLCLVAPDGTVLRANARWLDATGFRSEQVVGADILDLFPETRSMGEALHARARAGERVPVPRHRQLVLGRETWWDGSIAPVRMDGGTGLLITARELLPPTTERASAVGGDGPEASRPLQDGRAVREALAESEERLRATFTAMAEGVVLQHASGRIVSCNAAAERILGLTRDQLEGRTSVDPRWQAVREDGSPFPGEEHPAMVTLRTGEPARDVLMGVDAPGAGRRWISMSAEPLRRAPADPPYAVVATFSDITEARQGREGLEASERRYRSLFEHLPEEVSVFEVERHPDGRVKDWILRASNARARTFFAGRHAENLGRRLTELTSDDVSPFLARTEEILAGRVETHEVFLASTGKHYLATAFPIDDRTIISAAMDVTQRIRAEAELKAALTLNEQTLSELRSSLDHVKTLTGLLPICMFCHKVRNDQGYWDRLEQYLAEKTDVELSHGLCPDCLQSHYPGGG